MFLKSSNYQIELQDITSDSVSDNYTFKNPNFNLFLPPEFKVHNKMEFKNEYKQTSNNNYLSTSLIINKNKNIQEFEKLDNQTKCIIHEKKNNNQDLSLPLKNQKKIFFNIDNGMENVISNQKDYNKNLIIKTKKTIGRKRKSDKTKGEHNKFSDDNLRRKCKYIILSSLMEFINAKIKSIYNGDIGNSIYKKELLTLNKNQISDASIDFNKNLLNRTLGDIFSDTISSRFTNYLPFHNKNLIERLVNEEDEEKRKYFIKLFNLTFLQCLKHFKGIDYIEELDGMKCFYEIKEKYNDDKEYKDVLNFYINNFDNIINKKKSRKSRKSKIEEIENNK